MPFHNPHANILKIASYLKVHKNENFFGFNFKFCTISLLVLLIYYDFEKHFWLVISITNNEIVKKSKSEPKKLSFLCSFSSLLLSENVYNYMLESNSQLEAQVPNNRYTQLSPSTSIQNVYTTPKTWAITTGEYSLLIWTVRGKNLPSFLILFCLL